MSNLETIRREYRVASEHCRAMSRNYMRAWRFFHDVRNCCIQTRYNFAWSMVRARQRMQEAEEELEKASERLHIAEAAEREWQRLEALTYREREDRALSYMYPDLPKELYDIARGIFK